MQNTFLGRFPRQVCWNFTDKSTDCLWAEAFHMVSFSSSPQEPFPLFILAGSIATLSGKVVPECHSLCKCSVKAISTCLSYLRIRGEANTFHRVHRKWAKFLFLWQLCLVPVVRLLARGQVLSAAQVLARHLRLWNSDNTIYHSSCMRLCY